ncbi:MAG: dihydroorotase [Halanaerobium sp. 4-GBenrich]|jgi:dihydroorotase|uniref:Dihydroorotase n=1 Tax=Halanaerobium congolense TaxID=54121 RepID=A0A1G6Q984_9FIRM|nr:dihydroorotase [Halanaerobium congolense]ODS49567.1 MAG: dihydroorotase [Halanaerobium sp. 4-GBenrich]PXV67896.1 dihydroorotase [Halanaerobium congolense]TDS35324.1 dihydroorotase [Halanaerobium congolense]SDC88883.1 dihydroorotase [Halanaerobium congolense]SDH84514.1 dihydroorotase [Halanaerobium congolense]
MKTLIKNGSVYDSKNGLAGKYDILIEGKKIYAIEAEIKNQSYQVIDAEGKIIIPALIDMHTHLREPGYEEKETVKTGSEAAAAGGFSAVAAMPNTKPIADNPAVVEHMKHKAEKAAVRVYPIGSITQDSKGEVLSEIGTLAKTGVKALSDDGNPVMNSEIMRRAMEYASAFELPIIDHCEDKNLSQDGVMHEGYYSTIFGLKGIPAAAEEIMVARDIVLAEMTGIHLHIAHLSTEGSLNLVKEAKARGVNITFEVTPHHLLLTDKIIENYNPDAKVHPPLRSQRDKDILVKALKDGEIDVLATDHAPHTFEDKLGEFDYAAFGISGLETALALLYHNFIKTEIIDWDDLLRMYYYKPGEIMKIESEGLKEGARADLLIFNPEREWTVDKKKLKSKGKNTPFVGQKLCGKNELTFVGGKLVYDDQGGRNEILY